MPSPDLPHNAEYVHHGQFDGEMKTDQELAATHRGRGYDHNDSQMGSRPDTPLRYREDTP